jgi:hypothetical protein
LYISDEQEQNKTKTHSRRHITTQNIASGVTPLQREPTCKDKDKDKDKDKRIYHPAEDQAKRLPGGVGRPPGSVEPGLVPVQVYFEEEWLPRHLITFHICVGGKPTSK